MSDDISPEEKAEALPVLFSDALGQLVARYFLAGTLDELLDDFRDGRVSFRFSVDGVTVETPAPVSRTESCWRRIPFPPMHMCQPKRRAGG
jgi:hypothetical protein